jgi:hypothetical protein
MSRRFIYLTTIFSRGQDLSKSAESKTEILWFGFKQQILTDFHRG